MVSILTQEKPGGAVPVAAKVVEDDLSVAEPKDWEAQEAREKERIQFFGLVCLVSLLVLGAGFALGLGIGIKSSVEEKIIMVPILTGSPTNAPTKTPIPEQVHLLESLVPASTLETIRDQPAAPQALAYEWILEELLDPFASINFTSERVAQRFALATVFYSMQGDNWTQNKGWLNHSLHECEWFQQTDTMVYVNEIGIDYVWPKSFEFELQPCEWPHSESHSYQHLWLHNNQLAGTIPPEIGLLSSLRSVYLIGNSHGGTLPTQVGLLTNLEILHWGPSTLSGTIPSQIGKVSRLIVLNALNSNLSGTLPSELGLLTQLEALWLEENSLAGSIPSELASMTNAKQIHLCFNQLNGTIPSELYAMKKATTLFLNHNHLIGSISSRIQALSNLEELRLWSNQLTGAVPSEIGSLLETKILAWADNQLTGNLPSELGSLRQVREIDLSSNRLSGTLPSELGLLTNVGKLKLQSNLLEGSIPPMSQLPLSELLLHHNFLSGSIPSDLPAMHATVPVWQQTWLGDDLMPLSFVVHDNKLSGTLPTNSTWLQGLASFQITKNPLLEGIVPPEVCNITAYPYFALSTEELPQSFFDCTELLCGCDCNCSSSEFQAKLLGQENTP